ncbi:PAS domain-containing hybrid sensor histidine kinase/response regulator [Azospirillum thermophilum]|uniref:histidine kinase n=1 Tax=Azospirillum thermophilum TaxID=2202148 RepID=A0A2S2CVD8_9PROT|nr:PAS domain S-box protein [Azospirillum thermophilum]AWK88446.1 hybrid sensor histidine kinase/response regulator [Azospirillum thermophilum]
MTDPQKTSDPQTAAGTAALLQRIEALEAENAALRATLAEREDDGLTVRALNDDLRAVNGDLEESRRALAESERRLRAVFNSATDHAILTVDRQGRLTSWNPGAGRILGWEAEAIRGLHLEVIYPPEDRAAGRPARAVEAALAAGHCREERWYQRRDGSRFWGAATLVPLRDEDMEGFLCILRDLSRERESEEAARASHARTVEILESTSDAFYAVDHEFRFTYVNHKAEELWGRRREDLLGRIYPEIFPQIVGSEAFEAHLTAARERRPVTVETLSPILQQWIEARIHPSGPGGTGLAVYFRDVTERRTAQQALLRAKEEAERANLAKSKFLAAASHDLRQPLQSLLLFVDVLKPHVIGPRGHNALTHLGRGLDALKDLLDSLLDISRLDADIVEPVIEDFPIRPLMEHIAAAYQPVAAAKGLLLLVSCPPVSVRSDRTLLTRMVRNLIENALRYTEAGRIEVEARCIAEGSSGGHSAGGRLRIEVRDTGIGIPPDHLDRIWEEFHQVGNQERDRNRGLGLGLAIVKRLSGLLDHPVEVRSAVGRGACFGIELPLGERPARAEPAAAAQAPGVGRFAVLVDDDAIVLLGLETIFKEWGYEVLVAGSTDRALDGLRKASKRPDIVVADYRLRDGRFGTEAVSRIRDLYEEAIPGVILTGETGPDCERDAAAHGLGIIHKPVTPRQLSQALGRLFGPA